MDDCIGKHSTNGLRIDAKRTMANIHASRVEKLLLSLVSSSFYHRRIRKTDLKFNLSSPSLLALTTTKQKRDRRKLFHGGDIISALMSPSGKQVSMSSYS
jgi:hypothetical protein